MKTAVFAGSFDPFTLGHKDIALRAAKIFDKVIVAIAEDNGKRSKPIENRKQIALLSLAEAQNISILTFNGLLTDFLKQIHANFLVRGTRTGVDYEYEKNLMSIYRSQLPSVEFVLLPAKPELIHISSTVVRELVRLNGDIKGYVDTKAEKSVIDLYRE